MFRDKRLVLGLIVSAMLMLGACQGKTSSSQMEEPTPPLASELVFYAWSGYMPQAVLDAFDREFGVRVVYQAFETQEEAVENLRAGKQYDVVVLENEVIPALVSEGLLAALNYQHIPNFRNLSANFRDLAYDPANAHSLPFHWGTTGIVYRADLVQPPPSSWNVLWDPAYAGHVGLWTVPRDVISVALKTLGYSINSENPQELEAALDKLRTLLPNIFFIEPTLDSSAPLFAHGTAAMAVGWAFDAFDVAEGQPQLAYALPKEGTMLWGDNLTIPANSPNRFTAELFLNFIYRAEISAQIITSSYYPIPNDAALPLLDPEIAGNPAIFPPLEELHNAEIYLPLSPAGEKLYADIWDRFMADAHSVAVLAE